MRMPMPLLANTLRWMTGMSLPLAVAWARPGYFRSSPPERVRRVALVACHWIGDTFFATQVVPHLKAHWPDAELYVYTKAFSVDLWRGLIPSAHVRVAREVISDRRRERVSWSALWRLARSESRRGYDAVLDLTGTRYSAAFTFLLRPRFSIGADGQELGWLYSHQVQADGSTKRHLAEKPFLVVAPVLKRNPCPQELRPPVPAESFAKACIRLGLDPERPVTVLVPGAGWPEKEWPADAFAHVAAHLATAGHQVVIDGSTRQESLCRRVADQALRSSASRAARPAVVVQVGAPIGRLCGLLSGAAAVVCNDSGIGHLAAALGRRTVALFTGVTDPFCCRPLGRSVTVIEANAQPVEPERVAEIVLQNHLA